MRQRTSAVTRNTRNFRQFTVPLVLAPNPNRLRSKLFQNSTATLADGGIRLILADVGGVIPATFALRSIGFLHFDVYAARAVAGTFGNGHCLDDEQIAQLIDT